MKPNASQKICANKGYGEASDFLSRIGRDAALTVVGIRGASWLGGTKVGYGLNHNRYIRIGPGNIPKGKPFTHGPGQKVPTLRIGNNKPNWYNHIDLRFHGR